MREAIRRIVLRMWPELSGGYHLDRYARIVKISDPPTAGTTCDRFRPCWAADIEILTPEENLPPISPDMKPYHFLCQLQGPMLVFSYGPALEPS